jgi:hypothetical protein
MSGAAGIPAVHGGEEVKFECDGKAVGDGIADDQLRVGRIVP